MSRKYLSSYGIFVNNEENDVLADQQLDNIDGYSSTTITEVSSDGHISQDTVASEEEVIEETQEALEDLHEENEEKIENAPEEVTEEVVQASNETFLLCLGRLGFGTSDVKKLKLGFESYNTPLQNLKLSNKAIKNVIKEIRQHKRISREYNAFDWSNFFLGAGNTIYRAIFNKSKTTIDNPGMLIHFFLGTWTKIGEAINVLFNNSIKTIIDEIRGKGYAKYTPEMIKQFKGNIYKELIVNYKNNSDADISKFKESFKVFQDIVGYIKKVECKKIPERLCSTTEIKQLKLFRPQEIEKEIKLALNYYKTNGHEELFKLTNQVATFITNSIVKFLSDNVIID